MPIREGDGTGIANIRDGGGTGIAEVRTGGGDVLYSAGPSFPLLIDDFEDGNISEYTGDTGDFQVTDGEVNGNPPLEGSYQLANGSSTSIIEAFIASTSGLDFYPSPGNTIEYKTQVNASSGNIAAGFIFNYADSDNYNVGAAYFSDQGATAEVQLLERSSGTMSVLASSTISLSNPDTIQIEWGSGGSTTVTHVESSTSVNASVSGSNNAVGWYYDCVQDFKAPTFYAQFDDARIIA